MKILIIDDDADSRDFLREAFAAEGYDVVTARDGEEGLRMAQSERPSLVITDVLMPEVDGFQFLRTLKKTEGLKDIPVIFYTGSYLDKKDQNLALEAGAARYLIKPLDSSLLAKTVQEVLAEGARGAQGPPPSRLDEPVFLKRYNERLVRKLKMKMLENEMLRSSLEHIIEGMGDGVIVIGREYTILQVNSAAAACLGVEKTELQGQKCYELIHKRKTPCEGPHITCPLPQIFDRSASSVKALHTHMNSRGDEHHVEITASPVKDSRGTVVAMVESCRDIMEKKSDDELVKLVKRLNEAQTHLKHMAITDDLTGLRNRRYIVERLEEEFQRAKRTGRPLSLIMLDIDHFKMINDEHGHIFGDVVLRVVSSRMRESLRKFDLIGRVGGEEFLVVCPDSDLEDTIAVAERIRRLINDKPIGDGVDEVRVALSAGVAVLAKDDKTSDRLFSRADTALYKAKEEGRNRVVVL